jgi:hypothetical protein
MKNINTFEDFINESYLLEAMDISSDLAKVKTAADLKDAVGNKTLIIISKHEPTASDMKKRGGNWPMMHFARGLDTNNIYIDSIGAHGRASVYDLGKIAYDRTGWSKRWTLDEILEFLLFNKKRGNKIYTVNELPIKKAVKDLMDVQKSNMDKIRTLIGSSVQVTSKANIGGPKYLVWRDIKNMHGKEVIEFTDGKDPYSYFFSSYDSDLPRFENRRFTFSNGYDNVSVYSVNAKTAAEIHKLLQSNIDVMEKAIKIAQDFYKSENVNAAK